MSQRTAASSGGAAGALPLLSYGFRPFFLLAGLWAALTLPLWLAALAGAMTLPTAFDAQTWHVHEMLYGYLAATLTGFLLTAVPNWTGRLPLRGAPLALLALLWLAGRLAVLTSGAIGALPAALVDLSFLALLLFVILREILSGGNWRNLPVALAVALFFAGNLISHLELLGVSPSYALGERIGLAVMTFLIALIGGRIVPSFTRNWLVKRQVPALPAPFSTFDRASLLVTLVALALFVFEVDGMPFALAAGLAAAMNLLRLLRWRGWSTLAEPLLAMLHLAYLWLPLGFGLLALQALDSAISPSAALHALGLGAMGGMTLAVMTRATLGHTGRLLEAGPGTVAIYGLVTLAALTRVATALVPAADWLLHPAGAAWIAAFLLFLLVYGPTLLATARSASR
ncbi:MAG: NnrS family protein [Kiloniellales bacterium]